MPGKAAVHGDLLPNEHRCLPASVPATTVAFSSSRHVRREGGKAKNLGGGDLGTECEKSSNQGGKGGGWGEAPTTTMLMCAEQHRWLWSSDPTLVRALLLHRSRSQGHRCHWFDQTNFGATGPWPPFRFFLFRLIFLWA